MLLTTSVKKPLLLIFPIEHLSNYLRCLVIARRLRAYFDIRFLHSDKLAAVVYQQGFDTFSCTCFPAPFDFEKIRTNVEQLFLEQVQVLEIMQPALIIGDGITTLSMACEYTGIPYISLLNGYQSPYYAHQKPDFQALENHKAYKKVRSHYGLKDKYAFLDELSGDLNWICDLPNSFPQTQLPSHYVVIGPLYEKPVPAFIETGSRFSAIKKTIYLNLDHAEDWNKVMFLQDTSFQKFTIVTNKEKETFSKTQKPIHYHLAHTSSLLSKADLAICSNTEESIYQALQSGIPVLCCTSNCSELIQLLEQNYLGGSLDGAGNINGLIDYWVERKASDEHRVFQNKLNAAFLHTDELLLQSLLLHFPFLKRAAMLSF